MKKFFRDFHSNVHQLPSSPAKWVRRSRCEVQCVPSPVYSGADARSCQTYVASRVFLATWRVDRSVPMRAEGSRSSTLSQWARNCARTAISGSSPYAVLSLDRPDSGSSFCRLRSSPELSVSSRDSLQCFTEKIINRVRSGPGVASVRHQFFLF